MRPRTPTSAPPTPEMKVRFGKNLANCRNRADVSQEELGFRASIHRTEVSMLERGVRMPRVDTALRIAGSLGISLDDLVAGMEWTPGYEIVVPGGWEVAGHSDENVAVGSGVEAPPERPGQLEDSRASP